MKTLRNLAIAGERNTLPCDIGPMWFLVPGGVIMGLFRNWDKAQETLRVITDVPESPGDARSVQQDLDQVLEAVHDVERDVDDTNEPSTFSLYDVTVYAGGAVVQAPSMSIRLDTVIAYGAAGSVSGPVPRSQGNLRGNPWENQ
jgi:hypothetical protein